MKQEISPAMVAVIIVIVVLVVGFLGYKFFLASPPRASSTTAGNRSSTGAFIPSGSGPRSPAPTGGPMMGQPPAGR